jgi:DNA-binding transcriptional ArsR family regulator
VSFVVVDAAREIAANSYEAVIAPGYSEAAVGILRPKAGLELLLSTCLVRDRVFSKEFDRAISVVEAGSLSGAARDLGWTQPAVSQHLRALERKGYIRRDPHRPRALEVLSPGDLAAPVRSTAADVGFDDRQDHELKGVPGTWRLFAAMPSQPL